MNKVKPAETAESVALSNNTFYPTRGIMVSGSGDLAVTMADGTNITLPGLLVGVIYAVSVTAVKATGSTASGPVILFR